MRSGHEGEETPSRPLGCFSGGFRQWGPTYPLPKLACRPPARAAQPRGRPRAGCGPPVPAALRMLLRACGKGSLCRAAEEEVRAARPERGEEGGGVTRGHHAHVPKALPSGPVRCDLRFKAEFPHRAPMATRKPTRTQTGPKVQEMVKTRRAAAPRPAFAARRTGSSRGRLWRDGARFARSPPSLARRENSG